jgi:hypothetical protein
MQTVERYVCNARKVALRAAVLAEEGVGRGEITPNIIGVLCLLAQRPGMSQAELASWRSFPPLRSFRMQR